MACTNLHSKACSICIFNFCNSCMYARFGLIMGTPMQTCKQRIDDAVMVHKLELTDVSPETVTLMLDFLYGDFKARLTFAEAAALFRASHKYSVTELQQQCERALLALISQHTIYDLLNLATQYDSPAFIQVSTPGPLAAPAWHAPALVCPHRAC